MDFNVTYQDRTDDQWIVSLAEARRNLNIDVADTDTISDELLQIFTDSAADEIENYTDRTFIDRSATVEVSSWGDKITLPVTPVRSLSISYKDVNGDPQDLTEGGDYKVLTYDKGYRTKVLFLLTEFPALEEDNPFPITITTQLGFLKSNMPAAIKRAALLIVGNADSYRESAKQAVNQSVYNVLRSYRKF